MTDNELRQQAESGDKCRATPVLPDAVETPTNRKGKGGAPRGNVNRLRTGRRSGRRLFPVGLLGGKNETIRRHLLTLREALESQHKAAHGKVTIDADGLISTVVTFEMIRLLSAKQIREGVGDVLAISKTLGWATEKRQQALARLQLEGQAQDPWDAIHPGNDQGDAWNGLDSDEGEPDQEAQPTSGNAPSEAVGDVAADSTKASGDE